MDEARQVIARLERIEALRRADAPAGELLAELRRLLVDGERWLAAEHAGAGDGAADTDGARAALERCRARVRAEGGMRTTAV